MLLGLITLYFLQPEGSGAQYGTVTGRTFDMTVLFSNATAYNMGDSVFLGKDMQNILFAMLMIGFLVNCQQYHSTLGFQMRTCKHLQVAPCF